MRICYIAHSVGHFVAPYVDYFAHQGHEVHLISFSHEPLANAVNHHPLPDGRDPTGSPLDYARAIPAVRRLVRRIAPDLLHAHFLTSNGLVAAATGFHPLVVSARGSDVHYSLPRMLRRATIRFVLRRADLVNPVSEELGRLVVALGVPRAKTLCLTQGIDAERFAGVRRAAQPGGPLRMICTRKLQAPYRPEVVVDALARFAAMGHEFQFTFAAGGRDAAAIRALVIARGLARRVVFLGGYDADALPALLAAADLYVSAARWDGTSPALLEAMAAGVFPVVTDCAANREWLRDERDGMLVATDDAECLAAGLARAVADRDRWPAAAERNRRAVRERADRRTNLAIIAEHYARLVREFPRPGRMPAGGRARAAMLPGSGERAARESA